MITIYRLISKKQDNIIKKFLKSYDLANYMLGRRVGEYIVIKSDNNGDRVVEFTDYDVNTMQYTLDKA